MPEPKPFAEIFVYGPRVEGVHLRFSDVARGGLRWSDRLQDYRTEVLALARAQQVKNAVIVPNGAKGGFVPKQLPRTGTRDAVLAEGIAAYRLFVATLLDLTDNLIGGEVVPPRRVVRHDGNDPYLVVAADKGTATFSDIANAISAAHGHWLGDAFASGGSDGYDHKGMGITARGAFECVRRHFRELGKDIDTEKFRVAGVGDMSGDVFGNGMLLSRQTRLIAAFDHRDIFLDPDPDPEQSFNERLRLFRLPRSSWQDYDKALISPGGGVFSRGLKSVPLSEAVRSMLGIAAPALAAGELIRAILKADVDLLWFGGIGTYVRSTSESDEQVGDRANDAIRIAGNEVRAKVVGEGANLAVTQRGRIEVALAGGRIDTDFIDNSAGVNTSDKEVNIKIALGPAVTAGRLDAASRKALLVQMTDEVARSVLANNYDQGLALSLAELAGGRGLGDDLRLMRSLEAQHMLDRALEALASESEAAARGAAGKGLMRPELAVLLSYAKIWLTREVLKSPLPDEPAVAEFLVAYFPTAMRESYRDGIATHRLRREIIATGIANSVINRAGATAVCVLGEETGHDGPAVARALLAADRCLGTDRLWPRIGLFDNRMASPRQLALYARLRGLQVAGALWLLRQGEATRTLADQVSRYQTSLEQLKAAVDGPARDAEAGRLIGEGVPAELAGEFAALTRIGDGFDVAVLSRASGRPLTESARMFAAVGEHLRTMEIRRRGEAIPVRDGYDRRAIGEALDRIGAAHRSIAADILRIDGAEWDRLKAWQVGLADRYDRAKRVLDDIAGPAPMTIARLSIAAAEIGGLVVASSAGQGEDGFSALKRA